MQFVDKNLSTNPMQSTDYVFYNGERTVLASIRETYDSVHVSLPSLYGCFVKHRHCSAGDQYEGKISGKDLLFISDKMTEDNLLHCDNRSIEFSFDGAGDPLLNVEGVGFAMRRIRERFPGSKLSMTISGVQIFNLERLINNARCWPRLKYSLNSPFDSDRQVLSSYSVPVSEILPVLEVYQWNSGKCVEINYLLMDGFNDSDIHAVQLARLCANSKFSLKIALIQEDAQSGFMPSKHMNRFLNRLRRSGMKIQVDNPENITLENAGTA
jgi:adenine C2-methylase RlmN of 23S rRNA A2503 and tRNA A37